MIAALFDLDDTLSDRRASIGGYAERLFADFDVAASRDAFLDTFLQIDRGGYNAEKRPHQLAAAPVWHSAPSASELDAHWESVWPGCVLEREGARETLASLRAAGWRTGCVTNGRDSVQRKKLDRLGFTALLDTIVISESAGVKKPDPRIFGMVMEALRVEAHEAFFVGDHPINDVLGAARCGLTSVWLSGAHAWPNDERTPEFQVDSLGDVIELAKKWGPHAAS